MKSRSPKKKRSLYTSRTEIERLGTKVGRLEDTAKGLTGDIDQLAQASKKSFDSLEREINRAETRLEIKLVGLEARLNSKIKLQGSQLAKAIKEGIEKIMNHIDVSVENRKTDLLGVSQDELTRMREKTEDHEERVTVLEQRQGLRP